MFAEQPAAMDISRCRRFTRVLLISSLACTSAVAQVTVKEGQVFKPKCTGWAGSCHSPVVILDAPGGPVIFAEQGYGSLMYRLSANDVPTDELMLEDIESGGKKWTAIACQQVNGKAYVLLLDGRNKGQKFGMAEVNLQGTLSMGEVKEVLNTTWPIGNPNGNPVLTGGTSKRWLADYWDHGYIWPDRLRSSPSGRYMLVSAIDRDHWSPNVPEVGLFYAVVGPDLTVQRKEQVRLHKANSPRPLDIGITDNGVVYLLTHFRDCGFGSCDEIHLTLLDGEKVLTYTIDNALIAYTTNVQCLPDGRLAMAFTVKGTKGFGTKVILFDPAQAADPKIPLLDRRAKGVQVFELENMDLPNVQRDQEAITGVVALHAYDGGLLLTEEVREHRLKTGNEEGSIRLTRIDPQGGVKWSTTVDRYYAYWNTTGNSLVQVDLLANKLRVLFNDREADHGIVPDKKFDKQPEELAVVELDGATGAITSRAVIWRNDGKRFAQTPYCIQDASGATTLVPLWTEKGESQYLRLSE